MLDEKIESKELKVNPIFIEKIRELFKKDLAEKIKPSKAVLDKVSKMIDKVDIKVTQTSNKYAAEAGIEEIHINPDYVNELNRNFSLLKKVLYHEFLHHISFLGIFVNGFEYYIDYERNFNAISEAVTDFLAIELAGHNIRYSPYYFIISKVLNLLDFEISISEIFNYYYNNDLEFVKKIVNKKDNKYKKEFFNFLRLLREDVYFEGQSRMSRYETFKQDREIIAICNPNIKAIRRKMAYKKLRNIGVKI